MTTPTPIRLGVLGSTRGTDLAAIFNTIDTGELNATVEVVVSNKSKAYILTRARERGIPTQFIGAKNKSREAFDREVTAVLENHGVALILLVGFMRILSPEFCERWKNRILNVHPSLLPAFAGGMNLDVHQAVLDAGVTETGCTIHFVTADVDAGPIVIQKRCSIDPEETSESLKTKVQALEGEAFIQAIRQYQNHELDHLFR
ncbi:MAG: phosphoribosylglycinamide formyltransferase [Candidatus Marinimicrobia bacterium]|nr:phosphoribosylglycinamide formyltransferase [Candidatus Neomarinimicrobiota bacterium]MCF7840039.1 phosphoribosylglycinamide formyltransferase [Candidatus Neomarinimicrobiota bacterium]MCF7903044.1 phosphoribosylglycinamide formyltransferase [Candidatus Neomarinimicrobiota bacterium]